MGSFCVCTYSSRLLVYILSILGHSFVYITRITLKYLKSIAKSGVKPLNLLCIPSHSSSVCWALCLSRPCMCASFVQLLMRLSILLFCRYWERNLLRSLGSILSRCISQINYQESIKRNWCLSLLYQIIKTWLTWLGLWLWCHITLIWLDDTNWVHRLIVLQFQCSY